MMRYVCVTALAAALLSAPAIAQQRGGPVTSQVAGQRSNGQPPTAQPRPDAQIARQSPQPRRARPAKLQSGQPQPGQQPAANQQPFPALNAAEQQRLDKFLMAWETQSKGTKTLDLKFKRWHYDNKAAAAGIHSTKAEGVIRYANPDKGLFRVDNLVFFNGQQNGKPEFKAIEGQFGEHWICNGKQLIEMDRSKEECKIQDLPPEMQGKQIFNSPLPFVFNLDAQQIKQRYWIRLRDVPNTQLVMVEAWPKRQEDRAQYKLVQVGLDPKTFLPQALVMYAPNFDVKTAPNRDQYEFSSVKRNTIGAGLQKFINNFIPNKPPKHWKIVRNKFTPVVDSPTPAARADQQRPATLRVPATQNTGAPAPQNAGVASNPNAGVPAAQNARRPAAAGQRRQQ